MCTGNICRSPMAEAVFRAHVRDADLSSTVAVESAGTGSWHIGEPAQPNALATLARHGYDGNAHAARVFERAWFDRPGLIVGMDGSHIRALRTPAGKNADRLRLLREFDPAAGSDLDVPDPYGGPESEFEYCFELIEAACPGLLAAVRAEIAVG
ncbi:MAG: low molecular weight protein-tyrosine-phosphatase [Streptosporangiales bacterium]